MKIEYERIEGVEEVNKKFPIHIGCMHCGSFLAIEKSDIKVNNHYAGTPVHNYSQVICPCCNLPTCFGF